MTHRKAKAAHDFQGASFVTSARTDEALRALESLGADPNLSDGGESASCLFSIIAHQNSIGSRICVDWDSDQQILGNCSPLSRSTTRVAPIRERIVTRPG